MKGGLRRVSRWLLKALARIELEPPVRMLLARVGWDADAQGLFGAPPVEVLVGDEAYAGRETP